MPGTIDVGHWTYCADFTLARDRVRLTIGDTQAADQLVSDEEIAYCRRKRDSASSFAARFAAKEAAMKALGTGHSRGVFWRGIEVVRRSGPPRIRFHAGAAERCTALGATGSLLTLTHSRELAIAHVLLIR